MAELSFRPCDECNGLLGPCRRTLVAREDKEPTAFDWLCDACMNKLRERGVLLQKDDPTALEAFAWLVANFFAKDYVRNVDAIVIAPSKTFEPETIISPAGIFRKSPYREPPLPSASRLAAERAADRVIAKGQALRLRYDSGVRYKEEEPGKFSMPKKKRKR